MMLGPEAFYEESLKGKTPAQIKGVIRSLKQQIGRLKNKVEHPDYQPVGCPAADVQIACLYEYLERAKTALSEVGEPYVPTAAEEKAAAFEALLPHLEKLEFSLGGFFCGFEKRVCTVQGDKICVEPLPQDPDEEPVIWDKKEFLAFLSTLRLGQWRKRYDPRRFGFTVMDGVQWILTLSFSNGHRPVCFWGDNAYPYNFDRLLALVGVERRWE